MTSDDITAWQRQQQFLRDEAMAGRPMGAKQGKLIGKWRDALEEYDGPGEALLFDAYRIDRHDYGQCETEVTGLIIWDADGWAHHFRLYETETVLFLRSPEDPNTKITIDYQDDHRDDTVYLSDGIPTAVFERLMSMDVSPKWANACEDGEHDFELVSTDSENPEFVWCQECNNTRSTLSWLGHAVPTGVP